ncbi:MAG: hypothetical protein GY716_15710 [bacterium]|nr:hypothetical protein [bacterium]
MSKATTFTNEFLDLVLNNQDLPLIGDASGLQNSAADGSLYMALHTAFPSDGGDQDTSEAAYTSYARVTIARDDTQWTIPGAGGAGTADNTAQQQFPKATGVSDDEDVFYWSLGTAVSGTGKILWWGHLGAAVPRCFTATAADENITVPGHSYAVNDRIAFFEPPGSTLPTGMTEGTVYHVISVASDIIQVSATQGGGSLNLTADGSGQAAEISPLNITQNVVPQFPAGDVVVSED